MDLWPSGIAICSQHFDGGVAVVDTKYSLMAPFGVGNVDEGIYMLLESAKGRLSPL